MATRTIHIPSRRHGSHDGYDRSTSVLPPALSNSESISLPVTNQTTTFRLPKSRVSPSKNHRGHHKHHRDVSTSSSSTESSYSTASSATAPPTPVAPKPAKTRYVLKSRDTSIEERSSIIKNKGNRKPTSNQDSLAMSPLTAAIAGTPTRPISSHNTTERQLISPVAPPTNFQEKRLSLKPSDSLIPSDATQSVIVFNADAYKEDLAKHFLKEPLSAALTSPSYNDVVDHRNHPVFRNPSSTSSNPASFRIPASSSRSPIRNGRTNVKEDPLKALVGDSSLHEHRSLGTSPSSEHHVRAAKALMQRMMEEAMESLKQVKNNKTHYGLNESSTPSNGLFKTSQPAQAAPPPSEPQQHIRHAAVLAFINMCKDYHVPEDVIAAHAQVLANTMQNAMDAYSELHRRKSDDRVEAYEERISSAIQSIHKSRSGSPTRMMGLGDGHQQFDVPIPNKTIVSSKVISDNTSIYYPTVAEANVPLISRQSTPQRVHGLSGSPNESHESTTYSIARPVARSKFDYQQLAPENKSSRSPSNVTPTNSNRRYKPKDKSSSILSPFSNTPTTSQSSPLQAISSTGQPDRVSTTYIQNEDGNLDVSSSSPSPSPPRTQIPAVALVHTVSSAAKTHHKKQKQLITLLDTEPFSSSKTSKDVPNSSTKLSAAASTSSVLRTLSAAVKPVSSRKIGQSSVHSKADPKTDKNVNGKNASTTSSRVLSSNSNNSKSSTVASATKRISSASARPNMSVITATNSRSSRDRLLAEKAFLVQRMLEEEEKRKRQKLDGSFLRSGSLDTPLQQAKVANWNSAKIGTNKDRNVLLSASGKSASLDDIYKIKLQPDYLISAGRKKSKDVKAPLAAAARSASSGVSTVDADMQHQLEQRVHSNSSLRRGDVHQNTVAALSAATTATTNENSLATSQTTISEARNKQMNSKANLTSPRGGITSLSGSVVIVPQTANRWQKLSLTKGSQDSKSKQGNEHISSNNDGNQVVSLSTAEATMTSSNASFAVIPSPFGSFAGSTKERGERRHSAGSDGVKGDGTLPNAAEEIERGSFAASQNFAPNTNESLAGVAGLNHSIFSPVTTGSVAETEAVAWRREALKVLQDASRTENKTNSSAAEKNIYPQRVSTTPLVIEPPVLPARDLNSPLRNSTDDFTSPKNLETTRNDSGKSESITQNTMPMISLSEIIPPQLPGMDNTVRSETDKNRYSETEAKKRIPFANNPYADEFLLEAQRQLEETRNFIHNGFVNANHRPLPFNRMETAATEKSVLSNNATLLSEDLQTIQRGGAEAYSKVAQQKSNIISPSLVARATSTLSASQVSSANFLIPTLRTEENNTTRLLSEALPERSDAGSMPMMFAIPPEDDVSKDFSYGAPVPRPHSPNFGEKRFLVSSTMPSQTVRRNQMSDGIAAHSQQVRASSHSPNRFAVTIRPSGDTNSDVGSTAIHFEDNQQYITPPRRGKSKSVEPQISQQTEPTSTSNLQMNTIVNSADSAQGYPTTQRSKVLPSAARIGKAQQQQFFGGVSSPQPTQLTITHHHQSNRQSQGRAQSGQSTFGYVSSSTDSDSDNDYEQLTTNDSGAPKLVGPYEHASTSSSSFSSDYEHYFNANNGDSEQHAGHHNVNRQNHITKNRYRFTSRDGAVGGSIGDNNNNGPIGSNLPAESFRFNVSHSPVSTNAPNTDLNTFGATQAEHLKSPTPTVWTNDSRPTETSSPARFAVATSFADRKLLQWQQNNNSDQPLLARPESKSALGKQDHSKNDHSKNKHQLTDYLRDQNHALRRHFSGSNAFLFGRATSPNITTTTQVTYSEERSSGSPERDLQKHFGGLNNSERLRNENGLRTVTTSQTAITTRSVSATPTSRSVSPSAIPMSSRAKLQAPIGAVANNEAFHKNMDNESGKPPEWFTNAFLSRQSKHIPSTSPSTGGQIPHQHLSPSVMNASQNAIGTTAAFAPTSRQQVNFNGRFALPSR